MGANLMATRNRNQVIQTAIETVGRQLREPGVASCCATYPQGSRTSSPGPKGRPRLAQIGARA
jgi:hypothetical protein